MIPNFFADTVRAKARQTSRVTYFIVRFCSDRETMQVPSAYITPHTARQMEYIADSGPTDVGGSIRCTSSARTTVSSLNLWRATVSTAPNNILKNESGDVTHPYRSSYSVSNQSRHQVALKLSYYHGIVG